MRVIALTEELPYPPDCGWKLRTWSLLSRLTSAHDITLVAHADPEKDPPAAEVLREHGFNVAPVWRRRRRKSGLRFYVSVLGNMVDRHPYLVSSHRCYRLERAVKALLAQRVPAVVHCDWTPLVANVPRGCPVPLVVTAHNIESEAWYRHAEHQPTLLRRWYAGVQASKLERFEALGFRSATAVVAVSVRDAATISKWTTARVQVVPNGVDVGRVLPNHGTERPCRLVFVGSMDAMVNQDAVAWFARYIWPRLREADSRFTFVAVGRQPPQGLRRLAAREGFEIAADVADVRPFLYEAEVYVVPLRIGGGTRLKILEAWAAGKAVVSTPVGAEGLSYAHGQDIIVADTPEAFAEAVFGLTRNPTRRHALGERGREKVVREYSWDSIAPILAQVWHASADRGGTFALGGAARAAQGVRDGSPGDTLPGCRETGQ